MSTRLLWIIVILVIVVAGGWYLFTQMNAVTPSTSTQTTSGGNDYTPSQPTGGLEDGTISGDTNVSVNTQGYDALMSWTSTGYNPQTLTIKKGQTVRFRNDDPSGNFWPASDIHPTHSLYPEKSPTDCLGSSFDACRAISPGNFFDFTFNSAGTWGCHNHLHASQKCTIVVQ